MNIEEIRERIYKSKTFRQQGIECKENGNQIIIDLNMSIRSDPWPDKAIVCIKHKKECNSGLCRQERLDEAGVSEDDFQKFILENKKRLGLVTRKDPEIS